MAETSLLSVALLPTGAQRLVLGATQHLGNFPQAFTHLAMIEAIYQLTEAEQAKAAA
jgi:hypothetical protein